MHGENATMLQFEGKKGVEFCDGLSRRDFVRPGALGAGAVGLSLADMTRAGTAGTKETNCILLFLVGGPSQLDTWDLKPDAPDNVRGPFRPIRTNLPGIEIGEHFPLMAGMGARHPLARSLLPNTAPAHTTPPPPRHTRRTRPALNADPHHTAPAA